MVENEGGAAVDLVAELAATDAQGVEHAWLRSYYAGGVRGQFYDCFAQGYLMALRRTQQQINAARLVLEKQGRYDA